VPDAPIALRDTASGEEVTRLGSGVASYSTLVTDIDLGSGTTGRGLRGGQGNSNRGSFWSTSPAAPPMRGQHRAYRTAFWFGSRLPWRSLSPL